MHTPSDTAIHDREVLGVGTNWLKYSLQQCDKLGFTSVKHSYIVNAVSAWKQKIEDREFGKSDYKFEKPNDGSTTWTQYEVGKENKWMLTAHSFVVNKENYIWRVARNGDWNIALESMHTPPDISKQVVEESGRNWLEYSLQICAKLGFTSVGDDYLKEAVAVWDEKTCWSDPEEPEIVYVMLDNKDVGSATWDHYPTGGDWVKR